jgi:sigma-B regulation protein RsbU (phosphoserine phosphatase)
MQEIQGKDNKKSVKDFKLNTLLEITNAINNNLPEEQLFILFEYILQNQLSIGKAVIFINQDNVWQVVLQYNVKKEDLMINIEHELKKVTDITVLNTARNGSSSSFDVVIPIHHQSKALAYLLLGDLDEQARTPSPIIKHLGFIQTLANITAVAVENKRLEREHLEQEKLMQELRMANQMQEMLLPKQLPNNKKLQISAFYKPHLEVGGDFYDVIEISKNETVICMADVSGKGISAALMMANFQAHLRANLKVENDLEVVMNNLNEVVWSNAFGDRYITCFIAKYDASTRVLEYINAAHPAAQLIQNKRITELEQGCIGLGMFEQIPTINKTSIVITKNSTMLLYTDGITETANDVEMQFQDGEMQKVLKIISVQDTKQINALLIDTLDKFRGKNPYSDDVALISCRFF